jgi:hypothetical protein
MRIIRLSVLGLAGYGAYTLWDKFGARLRPAAASAPPIDDRRISARAELSVEEAAVGSDDPVAQAAAILAESDDRAKLPRDAPGVEHRRSQDTVEL